MQELKIEAIMTEKDFVMFISESKEGSFSKANYEELEKNIQSGLELYAQDNAKKEIKIDLELGVN